ncbi:STAS domain-containing protein [Streptomyces sp. MUM 203J]|uniref:STAS domain-containing protein n=1 Tax=Streptomyces sp. MUM 203J TaxID=2791990 RepID=UPI001F040081|nr:STAS domain-containing protein [Streptomyces sp. MUM 203J]MCH0539392.1 STAS domain-containing protein [Streptomyces sp. MUM 203J]
MDDNDKDPIVLQVTGPISPDGIPRLRDELTARLRGAGGGTSVVVDVTGLTRPDLVAVDALARLRLTARRLGYELTVRGAGHELRGLLDLTGLADRAIPLTPPPDPAAPADRTAGTSASRPGTT